MSLLLAVDLGLRTGLALYDRDDGLLWYRSQNYGAAKRLRRGVHTLLGQLPGLRYIVLEGGGALADIWCREATRRGIDVIVTGAEAWRRELLYPRQHRSGPQAKDSAGELARRVIASSSAARPTSLRHDAAEAILIGLWGMVEVGWLTQLPGDLRQG